MSSKDLDNQIVKVKRCEFLSELEVKFLCLKGQEILKNEGNVVSLSSPIIVCGDIHGQF